MPAPLSGPELEQPIRVALVLDPAGQGIAHQVKDGVRKAAMALEEAGYNVEEVEPPGIDVAAKTVFEMLAFDWQTSSPLLTPWMQPDTERLWAALRERPIHFGMQRRQLLNLKRLAERRLDDSSARRDGYGPPQRRMDDLRPYSQGILTVWR